MSNAYFSARPAPVPRRRGPFIVAVSAGVLAVVVLLLVWQRRRPTEAATLPVASVMVVERPGDLLELTLLSWPTGAVGECLCRLTASSTGEFEARPIGAPRLVTSA